MKYLIWSDKWNRPKKADDFTKAQRIAKNAVSKDCSVYIIEASHMWHCYAPEPITEHEPL